MLINPRLPMRFLLSFFALLFSLAAFSTPPSSWKATIENGEGTIIIYWHGSEPFIFYGEDGKLTGLEYDVFEGFRDYLKITHNVELKINWVSIGSFNNTFESVKNEVNPGIFACSAFSITENSMLIFQSHIYQIFQY